MNEKFTLNHVVLYAKSHYQRNNIWDDLKIALEMDGYLGVFEGDNFAQIKNRITHLILSQFQRLPVTGYGQSITAFYEGINPHNCWKHGYYTKGCFLRNNEELPDYDMDEAAVKYCLSYFCHLTLDDFNYSKADYTKGLSHPNKK